MMSGWRAACCAARCAVLCADGVASIGEEMSDQEGGLRVVGNLAALSDQQTAAAGSTSHSLMSTTLTAHEAACELLGPGAPGTQTAAGCNAGCLGLACIQGLPCSMLTVLQGMTQC
jgi:hypothetical protein